MKDKERDVIQTELRYRNSEREREYIGTITIGRYIVERQRQKT